MRFSVFVKVAIIGTFRNGREGLACLDKVCDYGAVGSHAAAARTLGVAVPAVVKMDSRRPANRLTTSFCVCGIGGKPTYEVMKVNTSRRQRQTWLRFSGTMGGWA